MPVNAIKSPCINVGLFFIAVFASERETIYDDYQDDKRNNFYTWSIKKSRSYEGLGVLLVV